MDKEIKILVVDDESDFRRLMKFFFESKGYSVTAAPDGETAIRLIKENAPHVVFLDLAMPVMDGVQTFKKIREFDKDLPIIIITAYVDRMKIKDVESYGISGVFYKGKDFEKGLSLLESILRVHKKLKK